MTVQAKSSLTSSQNQVFIRKVILENFLSFQKDEVDFEDKKFVIIVGPNWSGKTSIFQAIKFALGSNERDERYKKWSDFIRNKQNHAMVELHIQNGEDLIQIRRYVIRGQSPYFSIKRKKDKDFRRTQASEIQKIVEDLNYNPDNHFAFVSQGKIDAIKSLKPTELCSFLEEGIGLKGLREEILQQKGSVLNLNTELKSLMSKKNVLNISLELLKPKLERLEQKKKLLEIKKNYEDELLWANRKKLEEEIKNLKRNLLRIQVVIDEIKKKKINIESKISKFQKTLLKIEQNINDLSKNLGEQNYKRQELIAKIKNWQKQKIDAKNELDALAEKVNKLEKIVKNYESQKKSIDKETRSIREEKNKVEQKIEDLIKEQIDLTKKINLNEAFLTEYNNLISIKKTKTDNIKENEETIKSLNNEVNQIFQSLKDIDHKLEKSKWFLDNPSKNLLSQLDKDLRKTSVEQFSIESQIKEIEGEKYKKIKKLKPLQSSLRERRIIVPTNITIIKDEIKRRELNVKGPIIEYLKYDDKLSYAIESVLGEKLLYSFIVDNWDTLELLKRLKNKYKAYCNIYISKNLRISPLSNFSAPGVLGYLAELIKVINDDIDVKKVLYSKIKNCLTVNDYRSGKDVYSKYNFKGKCVTLKGEQIISYKYVYETPYVKQLKGLLSTGTQKEQSSLLEVEVNSLNDKISELRVKLSKSDNLQSEIYKKKESFNDLLYSFKQKQRLTGKKNQKYEERGDLVELNSKIRDEIEESEVNIKKLESQKDPEFFKWNKRIKEIPEQLNVLNNEEKKIWEQKLSENQKELKEIKDKMDSHKIDLKTIKQEYDSKKEDFQKADKEAFKIYSDIENLEEMIDGIKENISDLGDEKNKVQIEKTECDKIGIQITLELEHQNIQLNSLKHGLEGKKEDLERINCQIKPLVSENKIKIRSIEEIKTDVLKIDKELLKYYDIDDNILVERDQIMKGLKEITKNKNDLEKDINAAIKTENKMEETYFNKFKGVLNDLKTKINQKFKEVNVKSYCSLELEGTFEELGVGIKAATSEKQLKSCTALSGGQVSMISICLILSLQEMKPSPLCMLDEAAMFLDENNSEIAYKMIKTTLEDNPIQMFIFLPQSSTALFLLAEKLIGIARVGKNEVSTVFKPKIVRKDK